MRITHTNTNGKPQTNISLGRDGSKSITLAGHLSRAELLPHVGKAGEPSRYTKTMERLRAAGLR